MLSTKEWLHVEIRVVNSPEVEQLQNRVSELEASLTASISEIKRLQSELRSASIYRIRLSRAIKIIKRLGGDPSIFNL